MDWKQEPLSPLSADEVSWVSDDAALYFTSLGGNDGKLEQNVSVCESKAEIAAKLLEDLEHLQNLDEWIKDEEPFSNLWEEKMLFEMEATPPVAVKVEDVKPSMVPDTQSLLKEFENVFDAVELTHCALTPPQSPPYEQPHVLTTLEPITSRPIYAIPTKPVAINYAVPEKIVVQSVAAAFTRPTAPIQLEYITPATPQPDVAHELAVVDELVRTRVEDMVLWSDPSSPSCSSSSSGSSNFGDCSSDDPEWIPEPVDSLPQQTPSKPSRKRSKPYSRNVEEKKSRKKEQNKNAATRYRMKKKQEIEEVVKEENGLVKENEDLETKISDIQREIKYLKNLMRDLFKAKGLIH